jgi:putative lysine transport system substrate-binding protein
MKMKKVIATALVGFMAMGLLAGCGGGKDKQEENNTLRIGMECGYAPFNWTQQDDSNNAVAIEGGGYANGYDVQIAKKVADGLGKELVIVKTEWDGLVPAVQSGVIDGIIAGMSPTAERKEVIDFTDNYYVSDLVIVVKADGPYANATSIKDFAGAALTAQLNTFHDTVVDQIPGVNHAMPMETFPAMIVALSSGAIDGYVAEEPGAVADTTANPNLTYIKFDEGQGFTASEADTSIAVGLAKGSDLCAAINDILAGLDEETRLQMMLDATARQPLNQ